MIQLRFILLIFTSLFILSGCQSLGGFLQPDSTIEKATPLHEDPKKEQYASQDPLQQYLEEFITPAKHIPEENLWDELANHFYIIPNSTNYFKDYLPRHLRSPNILKQASLRAQPYLYFISQEVRSRQMPYEMALLPIIESGFAPAAKSHMGAAGLWQFMPNTGTMFGLNQTWWHDGRLDVYHSTQAALEYLQQLYKRNDNDWLLALASYNAGHGNVLRAKRRFLENNPDGLVTFWNIRPYLPRETQNYVPKLLAVAYLIKHREKYDIHLHPIENQPYFQKIYLTQQISVASVVQHTNISQQHFERLNPAYLKHATPPKGPHHLLLPIAEAKDFKKTFNHDQNLFSLRWAKHKIRPGESLSVIAQKYQTSSREIKKLNSMKSDRIRAGRTLLIPIPEKYAEILLAQQQQPASKRTNISHVHKVRPNESLWKIARQYNTSVQQIAAWNNINTEATLRKGQNLKIYSSKYGQKITHTLKQGESLWILAQKYNTSTQQIANWNQLNQAEVLQPGKKLKIWIKS